MKQLSKYTKSPFLSSWSGGKDSYYACYQAVSAGFKLKALLNNLNEEGKYSRSHRIPKAHLTAQARALDVPIIFNETSWSNYEESFIAKLKFIKGQYKTSHALYGDIDIEAHRAWEEKVSSAAGMEMLLPLWKKIEDLVRKMIGSGMKCLIVSCQKPILMHY